MSGLNKVILIGRLGADPEMRRTNAGNAIANMRIATSESWTDKRTGERVEKTEWHTVVVFNEQQAKIAEQYLAKGAQVCVIGKLRTRKWQDKNGEDRYSTEVHLENFGGEIVLIDSAKRDREENGNEAFGNRQKQEPKKPATSLGEDLDDDIPF